MKLRLVEDWRRAWRWWTVHLAVLVGAAASVFTAHPAILLGLIGFIPAGVLRYVAAGIVGLVVIVIPTALRVIEQPKAKEKSDA